MSIFQKTLFVLGWVCMAAWFILATFGVFGYFERKYLNHILFAVWCFSTGITQKSKKMKIFWYVLSVSYVILSMLSIFL